MLGDICPKCEEPVADCTCDCGCAPATQEPGPCLPSDSGYCREWLPMHCVYWMGDPIPGTPIKKGTKLTEIVTYLLQRIKDAEAAIV